MYCVVNSDDERGVELFDLMYDDDDDDDEGDDDEGDEGDDDDDDADDDDDVCQVHST